MAALSVPDGQWRTRSTSPTATGTTPSDGDVQLLGRQGQTADTVIATLTDEYDAIFN